MGQEGPRPANQTARRAGASGGGGAQSFTDVHTSLAGHTAWLGARQLGSPWQAGVGLQPAFLLSQSVEQSTEPAACTPAAPPLPPRHPGGTPDTASCPGSRPGPRPTQPALWSPERRGTSTHRGGGRGATPGRSSHPPASALQMPHSGAWRALPLLRPPCRKEPRRASPGREPLHPREVLPPAGAAGEESQRPCPLPPSRPSRRGPSCAPRARSSPLYRQRS